MIFYMGSHHPNWLGTAGVPLFVSRRRLCERKSFPKALARWALDSGGFSELSIHGKWTITAEEYVEEARLYQSEIGLMQFAAIQDWMCEPHIINGDKKTAGTRLSVEEHQRRTVQSMLDLTELAPVQGWEMRDYYKHIDMYEEAGINLLELPVVGLGSVCRRQHTGEVEELIKDLSRSGMRLHGFGFKKRGLQNVAEFLHSADSMAWSYHARRKKIPIPECSERFAREGIKGHKNCANCLTFALQWRESIVNAIKPSTDRKSPMPESATTELVSWEDSQVTQSDPDVIRKAVLECIEEMGKHYYRLGNLLWEVKEGELFLDWGYASWEEYAEIEVGRKKRACQEYMRIAGTLDRALGIPWNEVRHIGWSKLKTVEPLCDTVKTAMVWIKKAEKHSRKELEVLVRREQAKRNGKDPDALPVRASPKITRIPHNTDEEIEDAHNVTVTPYVDMRANAHKEDADSDEEPAEEVALHEFKAYLFPDQYSNWMAAVESMAQMANSDKVCFLMDLIATEINQTLSGSDQTAAHRLDWYVKNLERVFECKITVELPRVGGKLREMVRVDD